MSFNQKADLVLLNGKIITVDPKDTIAEAVAVKDGKIIMVDTSNKVTSLVSEKTEVIELNGRTVVPGFIDAHVHLDSTSANTKLAVDCHISPVRYIEVSGNSVSSVNDILERIKERVDKLSKGEWIIGQGRFALRRDGNSPTKKQLDEIAPENPVVIRYSGHDQIYNSKALELAKITKDRPTKEELERLGTGARIWKHPTTGEPTGVMTECWDWMFGGSTNCPWPYEQLKEAIKKTCYEAIKFGVTSINELFKWPDSVRIYQELIKTDQLPLRLQLCPTVYGYYQPLELDCLIKLGLTTGFGNEQLKFGSVKIFVDAAGSDEKGIRLNWNRLTQEELNELVSKAHKAGIRVMMHSTTRNGHNAALDAVESALKETPRKDHRHRIEHFGGRYWPPEYERLKKLRIMPIPTPYSSYGWYGDAWLKSAKSGEKVVFYRTLIDDCLKPPGNSDCVGTEPEALNPWWSIWCMVARKTKSGELICPEEGVTVMEAIRIYTMNSAYAGFEEDIKGSIELGKLADLVVLNRDPLTVPTDQIQNIEVEMTIIGGKIVYRRND